MSSYLVEVNWAAIHAAAAEVDRARHSGPGKPLGFDGLIDVFGGTYVPSWYEGQGPAGLCSITLAARELGREAWNVIHAASRGAAAASVELEVDSGPQEWWSVTPRGERSHRTHRGARWRATHYRGIVEQRPNRQGPALRAAAAAARVDKVLGRAQAAMRTALALHPMLLLLGATGITEYDPQSQIPGQWEGRVNLPSLGWLVRRQDQGQAQVERLSLAAARAFAAGGLEALRAAVAPI